MKRIIFGLALCLAVWGCSDDKTGGTVPPDPGPEPEVPTLATSLAFGVPSVEFPSGGKTVDVAVVAEGGEWAVAETPDWLAVTPGEGKVTLAADDNRRGSLRSGKLRITGAENVEASLDVSQGNGALILRLEVEAPATVAAIPLHGQVSCTIDWGDGAVESIDAKIDGLGIGHPSHEYAAAGTYRVSVSGTVPSLSSIKLTDDQALRLKAVEAWGATGLEKMQYAFYRCAALESIPSPGPEAPFARVTTFSKAFDSCDALREIPADLFAGCTELTDLSSCFNDCDALKSIPEHLLDDCTGVEKLSSIFAYCRGLESVPGRLFAACSKVTDLGYLFTACESLRTIPADLFAGCSAATTFMQYFSGCEALGAIPAGLFDDCTQVEVFQSVFMDCVALKSIPEGLFDKHPNAVKFNFTFADCTGIESVPVSLFDNCRKATAFTQTFRACSAWQGESPYTLVDGTKVHLYERSKYPDAFEKAPSSSTNGTFRACTGLADYEKIAADYPKWVK